MKLDQIARKQIDYFSREDAVLAKEDGQCYYRDSAGNKCAVGCLIPADLYDDGMEDNSVDDLFDMFPEVRDVIVGEDDGDVEWFLQVTQSLHDVYAADAAHFVRLLRQFSENFRYYRSKNEWSENSIAVEVTNDEAEGR